MSQREYRQWVELYNREPWGDYRDDWRMSLICSAMAGGKPGDWMPDFHWDDEEADETDIDSKMIKATAMMAAANKKKSNGNINRNIKCKDSG